MNSRLVALKTLTSLSAILLPASTALAEEMALTVRDVPVPGLVSYQPAKRLNQGTPLVLDDGSRVIPVQFDRERIWWYQPESCDAQGRTYRLRPAKEGEVPDSGVKVARKGRVFEVTIDGQPFTAFNTGKDLPKPFLYPVIGPTGAAVTRHYPMKDVQEERGNGKKTRQDHPHHRSIWTAHGDVRTANFNKPGTDYWAQDKPDADKPSKGLQKVFSVSIESGPVFGRIRAEIDWLTPGGKKELGESRTYTFYKTVRDERVIDVKVVLRFTEGDVMFADTKEGGILSLRIATSMDEIGGGKMVNSRGQTGMKECWGRQAEWCDYVGPVEGQTVGIAVFDAKTNFRHPTRWHIRDYGLYTANPFMAGAATKEQKKQDPDVKLEDGSKTWKKGESAEFNYRIFIHKGDTQAAKVAEHYQLYTGAPQIALK